MHHMFGNKEAFLKLCRRCIMFLPTRKQFKSCGVNALSVGRQGNSSRILVSMHHVFVDREAFKGCDVNALCFRQQGSSLKVVV